MRKLWLSCAVLLLSAAWMAAQTGGGAGTSTQPAGQTAGTAGSQTGNMGGQSGTYAQNNSGQNSNKTTLEGCLSGSAGSYTLTANNGMTYQLQGKDNDLSKHVGQEVKVKGTAAAGASGSMSGASSNSAGTPAGAASQQTFEVSKVKKVSKTCTTGNTSNPSSR